MSTSREAFCWMTAQVDGIEHAVTDDAQATGVEAGKGWFEPLCGQRFLVACMDAGPLGRCGQCEVFVRARADLRDFDERLTEYRRPGWLSRLLCRYGQPAGVGGASEELTTFSGSEPRHRLGRHAA